MSSLSSIRDRHPGRWPLAAAAAVAAAGIAAFSTNAQGGNDYIGSTGGEWSVASNWSLGTIPSGNVDVSIASKNVVLKSPLYYSNWVWVEVTPPEESHWELQTGYTPQHFTISSLAVSGGDLRLLSQSPANTSEWPSLTAGGLVSLSNASVTVSQGVFNADGPVQFANATISADTGSIVTFTNVPSISQRSWSISAHSGATINMPALSGIAGGTDPVAFTATDANSLITSATLSVLPNIALSAYSGGKIALPGVTSAAGNQQTSSSVLWRAAGGTLELPNLTAILQRGLSIEATANGTIDLHKLTQVSGDGNMTLYAAGGGTIRTGLLSEIQFIQVEDGGHIDAAGATSILSTFLRVRDATSTLLAPDATTMGAATLQVWAGGSVTLPAVTSVTQREVYLSVSSGGTVSLPALASIVSGTSAVNFTASDADSVITAPLLTMLPNVGLEANPSGRITLASVTTAEGNEQPYASLFWRAAGGTLDVPNVSTITKRGLVIEATSGGQIDIRGLTSVTTEGTGLMNIHASGTGSLVTIGTLSGFSWVHVGNGGKIDASTATSTLSAGAINVDNGELVLGGLALTGGYLGQTGGSVTSGPVTIGASSSFNQFSGSMSLGNVTNAGSVSVAGTTTMLTLDSVDSATTAAGWSSAGFAQVSAGGLLTASRVRQASLTIHGTSTTAGNLVIAESSPGFASGVPAGDDAMVSVVQSLAIDNDGSGGYWGKLDLKNNDLIIDYSGISPIAMYEAMVAAGFGGGTWTGPGITSSIAALNTGLYNLAIMDNAQLAVPLGDFDGIAIDPTTIIIKFAYVADIDQDGVVTPNDAIAFSNNYAEGSPANHLGGDLNYNGIFDPNDAIAFANAYNESLAHLPEPASLALLAAGTVGLLIRKRRRLPPFTQAA